jgi:hypothetical protein
MSYNFLRGDRDQPFLLSQDPRDWLPEGQLAWFVLDVVDQLDLTAFYRVHRDDGHSHPAYDPKLLLGVLLYAYAIGGALLPADRAPLDRGRRLPGPGANQAPDHVTIARFRVRHEHALAGFLVASLRPCAAAGMGSGSAPSRWTGPSSPATPPQAVAASGCLASHQLSRKQARRGRQDHQRHPGQRLRGSPGHRRPTHAAVWATRC